MDKPPYRVPLMAEITGPGWPDNGLSVVTTFAGGGGSSTGYRLAGCRVRCAVEFTPAAVATYQANWPGTPVIDRDIRQVTGAEILERAGLAEGELDILDGSPPCDPFSTSGARDRKWGTVKDYLGAHKQRTDDLFPEFARLVGELRPRAFVAENVSGLVKGRARGYFLIVLAALREQGYRVRAKLLDASWLGVPQKRQRLFFVGVRDDLGIDPPFPKPLPYRYSLRDAIPGIAAVVVDGTGPTWPERQLDAEDESSLTVQGTGYAGRAIHQVTVIAQTTGDIFGDRAKDPDQPAGTILGTAPSPSAPEGKLPAGMLLEGPEPKPLGQVYEREWRRRRGQKSDKRVFNLVREDADRPGSTVVGQGGANAGPTHPYVARRFTIPELRRIGSFPDDYVLTGSFNDQWQRIGQSVPPVMMAHVASALASVLTA